MSNRDKIIIVDLDGTYFDITQRRGYVRVQPSNWNAFNETIYRDDVNEPVKAVYNALQSAGFYMVFFSGRGNDYREITEKLLSDNGAIYDELHMRHIKKMKVEPFEDGISDITVKERMLSDLKSRHPDKTIFAAIDDRFSVCSEVWVKNGVFLFDVGQHNSKF